MSPWGIQGESWTTHPVHNKSLGEGWTTHPMRLCLSKRRTNHSSCLHSKPLGEGWTSYPMVAHHSKKYPMPPGAPRAQYPYHTRPSGEGLSTIPSRSRKVKNLSFPRGFIWIMATCTSVLEWWSLLAPRCTISQIKWYLISICLERS